MSHRTFANANSIEARQHLLDNRCEHAPKRHRVRQRSKRASAAKRTRVKHALAIYAAKAARYHAAVAAYWAGTRDGHPGVSIGA